MGNTFEMAGGDMNALSQTSNRRTDGRTDGRKGLRVSRRFKLINYFVKQSNISKLYFREEHERVLLEEAQVRYELNQLQKDLASKLSERDEAHSERIKLMEQVGVVYFNQRMGAAAHSKR